MSFLSTTLTLEAIEDRNVILAPRRGSRGFITESQKSQLAQLISDVLGKPVNVQVKQKTVATTDTAVAAANGGLTERQMAMRLPLVLQISEHYDVSLVDVSDELPVSESLSDATENDEFLETQEQDDV